MHDLANYFTSSSLSNLAPSEIAAFARPLRGNELHMRMVEELEAAASHENLLSQARAVVVLLLLLLPLLLLLLLFVVVAGVVVVLCGGTCSRPQRDFSWLRRRQAAFWKVQRGVLRVLADEA